MENDRFRLGPEIAVDLVGPAGGNQVVVYFTADASGRMPADAVWQSAGARAIQNRGPARLEALAIEVKDARGPASGTPGEALDARYGVNVSTVIDNNSISSS